MNYWIVKSEPHKYSWEQFMLDKRTVWDGVRNYQARNNLREMKKGDLLFFYHSNEGKQIMGIAKLAKEYYQDPTTTDSNWLVVEITPFKKLKNPVTLAQIKAEKSLKDIALIRQGRLSVMPINEDEFNKILTLSL